MKKNVRNALAISGLALAIGASGLTLTASANTAASRDTKIERHQSLTKIARVKKTENIKDASHRRTFAGVASNISANSLTITRGAKTFTVTTTDATRILNRNWTAIKLSDIKDGDKVRVQGTLTDTTIAASTLRDITIK